MTAPCTPGFSSFYSFFFRPTRPGGGMATPCVPGLSFPNAVPSLEWADAQSFRDPYAISS